ncbi:unnamed protein product [Pleuronectes platessa]|uniref:Uncharacterized protein n=1 Tax=Pleuronectes platessa TaxID=8262 RepID=A0A9N7YZ54_PLEPL|nr:unnamed protein product [Pleuronectes platessa]
MEEELAKHLKHLADQFHGLAPVKGCELGFEYAEKINIPVPANWTEKQSGFDCMATKTTPQVLRVSRCYPRASVSPEAGVVLCPRPCGASFSHALPTPTSVRLCRPAPLADGPVSGGGRMTDAARTVPHAAALALLSSFSEPSSAVVWRPRPGRHPAHAAGTQLKLSDVSVVNDSFVLNESLQGLGSNESSQREIRSFSRGRASGLLHRLMQIALRSIAPPPASRTRSERHSESRARSRGAASQ